MAIRGFTSALRVSYQILYQDIAFALCRREVERQRSKGHTMVSKVMGNLSSIHAFENAT
jgi:hypothetical protein